ncbi:MAG: GntR family transcriptional regulator [Pigmentiphaga sp.]|uniref:GntR family transcriptional regulator n=1 Tax=Pigmentiphaga sp. TaxID=1977564 RepID=UPI0029A37B86|nr:GntR family transcriptional regulator [Pigmentiphaga sp.]MDX3905956.1 GntR family transcriptional regulator [Pigmentiphaga sp.]
MSSNKISEQIRQAVEECIRTGTLLPGDPIDEAEWSRRFDVSRTPVREAILQLQAQGLVISQPRGGMVVAKLDLQQLVAMWELLAELEGFAARLACERMIEEERQELASIHEAAAVSVDNDDLEAWYGHNSAFHEVLYTGSRNPYLRHDILRMRAKTAVYRRHAYAAVGHLRSSYEQHGQILAAVMANDSQAAFEAMVRHMSPGTGTQSLADLIVRLPRSLLN